MLSIKNNEVSRKTIVRAGIAGRHAAHEMLVQAFLEKGLTQAEVAKRMGKKREQVNRWLAAPLNMRLETFGELYAAITGNQWEPQDKPQPTGGLRNDTVPHYMTESVHNTFLLGGVGSQSETKTSDSRRN